MFLFLVFSLLISSILSRDVKPFVIDGDDELKTFKYLSNPGANGTEEDPFVVTELKIEANDKEICVTIRNTKLFLNLVKVECVGGGTGISLESVRNLKLSYVTISKIRGKKGTFPGGRGANAVGLMLNNVVDLTISDCTFSDIVAGMSRLTSNDNVCKTGHGAMGMIGLKAQPGGCGGDSIAIWFCGVFHENISVTNTQFESIKAGYGGVGAVGIVGLLGGDGSDGGSGGDSFVAKSEVCRISGFEFVQNTISKSYGGLGDVGGVGAVGVVDGGNGGSGGNGGMFGVMDFRQAEVDGVFKISNNIITHVYSAEGAEGAVGAISTLGKGGSGGNGGKGGEICLICLQQKPSESRTTRTRISTGDVTVTGNYFDFVVAGIGGVGALGAAGLLRDGNGGSGGSGGSVTVLWIYQIQKGLVGPNNFTTIDGAAGSVGAVGHDGGNGGDGGDCFGIRLQDCSETGLIQKGNTFNSLHAGLGALGGKGIGRGGKDGTNGMKGVQMNVVVD